MGRYLTGEFTDGSNAAGSGSTQVKVTAADHFEVNDPVFLDWKSGSINNFNNVLAAAALTAGPSTTYFTADQSDSTGATSISVYLPDGSLVMVMASRNASNQYKMTARKFTSKGAPLASNIIEASTANTLFNLRACVLSNGNIAIGYLSNSATGKWAILNPQMQVIYSGSTAGPTMYHIQETNNGGFLVLHSKGIQFISATGTQVTVYNGSVNTPGTQDELNDNALTSDNYRSATLTNYAPVGISNGGYGFIFASDVGVFYIQINADGTARGAVANLTSYGSQAVSSCRYARNAATGNICWAEQLQSNVGNYGIVGDDGAIIKASASLSVVTSGGGQYLKLISDSASGFMLAATDATPQWTVYYMSAGGVAKTGYPKIIGSQTHSTDVWRMLRLSTGIVFLCPPTAATLYQMNYYFFTPSSTGTETTQILYAFGAGNSFMTSSAMVVNDVVYGVVTTGAAHGTAADQVIFSIDTAGVKSASPCYTGVQYASATVPRLVLDASGLAFSTIGSTTSQTLISTYDLQLNNIQSYTITDVFSAAHICNDGYTLRFCDVGYNFTTTTPAKALAVVKQKPTVLLGVAASPAAPGAQLLVNTKGLYSGFAAWKTTSQTFDHSGNNPPGNKGWINNGVISLGGF
ncbi:MAG: hypothetical protein AB7F61_14400 [Desulfobulbus sp.]